MYWYLSFLRPPPKSVSVTEDCIQITPQIANDLRTELRYVPTDIGYVWQRVQPASSQDDALEHLTTWTPPQSTYKTLSVPLPTDVKPGQSWRLGLETMNPDGPNVPSLASFACPNPPIVPVWSAPIQFIQGAAPAVKQDRIQREWMIAEDTLRVIEQTSFDLDKKIWDSGLALSAWLWYHLIDHADRLPNDDGEKLLSRLRDPEDRTILELGGGTGLVSHVLRQAFDKLGCPIVTTDLDTAIPLMEENIALNRTRGQGPIKAQILNWDEPLPSLQDPWPSIIIAADVTYNTASFPSLLRTLCSLMKPTSAVEAPMLLLAYKERDPGERELWEMLRKEGIRMTNVDVIQGAEEEGVVELWVGSVESP
ncbi:putative methyltransferase-domain-containing protein [Kockovaella imperatae]|uniref:Putative methyltransferase-domain-containing protein n=1 Tax=Kockovaella imperatae TaxID=4999 RepID=A0A1Y1U962_9TREE|nr:putative methyltransferase-domain-containing protein [Kockovaella imperatae]ORX33635.1 putative methyltransferase-domain-containing protein [Kockovaella imperatae]